MNLKIYHNPRCKKSRTGLQYLQSLGHDPEIILYLENKLTIEDLERLHKQLNIPVENLIRKQEDIYKSQFKGKSFTDEEWIRIIAENPKLMMRPVVLRGHKAVIGDPVENIDILLR